MKSWHFWLPGLIWSTLHSSLGAQGPLALEYSTFIDGGGGEIVRDLAHDAQGNLYVTGGTYSPDFPTTSGAYRRTLNPGTTPPGGTNGTFPDMDVFVMKFTPGGQLVWSTLLGGPQYDRAYAIELDAEGNVYVGGRAGPGFPVTTGALQENFIFDPSIPNTGYGDQDAFIAKISPDGGSLLWATYIGSPMQTLMRDFRVDPARGVVHCGVNRVGVSFQHTTPGALQTTLADDNDAAYLKLAADDGRLIYGTLLGGVGDEYRPSLTLDGNGGAYIMIQSSSVDLPAPQGGFRQGPNGGSDFAVYHFDANQVAVSGTYFGGSGNELTETHGIARAPNGDIYLSGGTTSADFPATHGAYQTTMSGPGDAFVARLSGDLSQILAATYFGGSDGGDDGEGLVLAPDGSVVVAGIGSSSDMPTTPDALIPSHPGGRSGALKRFSADLTQLLYASYISGTGQDDDARIAHVTDDFDIYVGGLARSNDFPTTSGFDTTQSGAYSGFLMKFSYPDSLAPIALAAVTPSRGDAQLTVTLDGSGSSDSDGTIVDYAWSTGQYVLASGPTANVVFPAGSFPVTLTVTNNSGVKGTDTAWVDARAPAPDPDLVAWWRCDEDTGMTAADSSGNGHKGTLEHFATDEWEAGWIDGALRIENGTERVRVAHHAALNLAGTFTVSAWIKLNQIPFYGRVVVKGGEQDGWGLVVPNAPRLNWVYGGTGYATSEDVLATGRWQHVAVSYDGDMLRYYVDGVLVEARAEHLVAQPNTDPVLIGNHPTLQRPLNGAIDELRLMKRVLSPLEIAAMALQTHPDSDGDALPDDRDTDDDDDELLDAYESHHGFDPLEPDDASIDHDLDTYSTRMEHLHDTDPRDPGQHPSRTSINVGTNGLRIEIPSSSARRYTLEISDDLEFWEEMPLFRRMPGNNGVLPATPPHPGTGPVFFRFRPELP